MGTRFVPVMLLVALVGASQVDGFPKDLSFIESLIEPYADCKFGAMSCSADCKTVQVCLGGGSYEIVETCATGSKCDASKNATCNADLKECNQVSQTEFKCHGKVGGLFPNPYDCHSYYECKEPINPTTTVKSVQCKDNTTTAFDSLSSTCRFTSNHRVCKEGPVPTCTKVMQSGALIENPNIFYVCVTVGGVLQPVLARCPLATDVFVDEECINVDLTSTSVTGPTTTEPTSTDTTPTPTETTPTPTETTPTSTETTPTPTETTPTSTATTPTSTETTPTPTETTPTPTETTPTPTETTPTPTETTPTSTATTLTSTETTPTSTATTSTSTATTPTSPPTTTERMYCTTPGTTVPDPFNCRGYYLCTMDMEQIHFFCQNGYHYDKELHRCVKGSC